MGDERAFAYGDVWPERRRPVDYRDESSAPGFNHPGTTLPRLNVTQGRHEHVIALNRVGLRRPDYGGIPVKTGERMRIAVKIALDAEGLAKAAGLAAANISRPKPPAPMISRFFKRFPP